MNVSRHSETPSLPELLGMFEERARSAFFERVFAAGLTPPLAAILKLLTDPIPMRSVAEFLSCDASVMTGFADRLEERGLVQRTADPTDRRVKLLAITPEGIRARDAIFSDIASALPGVDRLSAADRKELERILWKMLRPE
jgi:DNA-binding MarR family transcriptional regulator